MRRLRKKRGYKTKGPGPTRTGAIWLLGFLLICSSCGYKFFEERNVLGGQKRICIPVFKNRTMENGAEFIITNSFINEFAKRGFVVISNKSKADDAVILSGVMKSMSISTISELSGHSPLERRVRLAISLKLAKNNGAIIWRDKEVFDAEAYRVAPDKLETERNRKKALSVIAKRLGENVFYMMTGKD